MAAQKSSLFHKEVFEAQIRAERGEMLIAGFCCLEADMARKQADELLEFWNFGPRLFLEGFFPDSQTSDVQFGKPPYIISAPPKKIY